MTYAADDGSTEHSEPREGIELILPTVTYRVATGTRDITINGQRFTASPAGREEISISTATDNASALELKMPMSHYVPQRWMGGGVPPKRVLVNVYRMQIRSGEYQTIYRGYIESLSSDGKGTVAKFNVPSRFVKILERRLPVITTSRSCPHVLYDRNCRVARDFFRVVETTIDEINGRNIRLVTDGGKPDNWAEFGELVHVPSGERMTIQAQVGSLVTIQLPIYGMAVGDAVEMWQGCDHTIDTCIDSFVNRVNFGGFPQMLTVDIMKMARGFGVYAE